MTQERPTQDLALSFVDWASYLTPNHAAEVVFAYWADTNGFTAANRRLVWEAVRAQAPGLSFRVTGGL